MRLFHCSCVPQIPLFLSSSLPLPSLPLFLLFRFFSPLPTPFPAFLRPSFPSFLPYLLFFLHNSFLFLFSSSLLFNFLFLWFCHFTFLSPSCSFPALLRHSFLSLLLSILLFLLRPHVPSIHFISFLFDSPYSVFHFLESLLPVLFLSLFFHSSMAPLSSLPSGPLLAIFPSFLRYRVPFFPFLSH